MTEYGSEILPDLSGFLSLAIAVKAGMASRPGWGGGPCRGELVPSQQSPESPEVEDGSRGPGSS